jgi:hypothetical protein
MGWQEAPRFDRQDTSLKERRVPGACSPSWQRIILGLGTFAVHTTFMRELYGQQWVKLYYDIMQKELFQKNIIKSSAIKCKAFETCESIIRI